MTLIYRLVTEDEVMVVDPETPKKSCLLHSEQKRVPCLKYLVHKFLRPRALIDVIFGETCDWERVFHDIGLPLLLGVKLIRIISRNWGENSPGCMQEWF